jgi:hypothetical protein
MPAEGVDKGIPFVVWDDALRLVVGEEALVLHVGLLEEVGAFVGVALLGAAAMATTAFSFLWETVRSDGRWSVRARTLPFFLPMVH